MSKDNYFKSTVIFNRPFPSSPGNSFQNEGRCSTFDMEIIFHSHANKTHFHQKGCAPSLNNGLSFSSPPKCRFPDKRSDSLTGRILNNICIQ